MGEMAACDMITSYKQVGGTDISRECTSRHNLTILHKAIFATMDTYPCLSITSSSPHSAYQAI